jgi:hypothetical protein
MSTMENEDCTDPRDAGGATSRRALLGAASGFALVASGLFLPEWMEETEARKGAYGGKLGGRHGKNRRGRDKQKRRKRRHGKHRREERATGSGPGWIFRNSRLRIFNQTGVNLTITVYFQEKTGLDSYNAPVNDGWAELESQFDLRYDPDRFRVGARIEFAGFDQVIDVNVRNMSAWYPQGRVKTGVGLPLGGDGGLDLVAEQDFPVRHTMSGTVPGTDFDAFLTRESDTDCINWSLIVK